MEFNTVQYNVQYIVQYKTIQYFNTEVNSKLPFLCISVFIAVVTVHNIFDLVSFRTGIGRFRFAKTRAAVTHRQRTNLGRGASSIAGPSVWNSLPQSLLNTYFFNVAFS